MIAAIDPGAQGAIAMFYKDGQLAYVHDMPLTRLVGGSTTSPTPLECVTTSRAAPRW